jgi:rSAM/selenodomain-associated transferase 1
MKDHEDNQDKDALILLVRYPRAGQVKTRLAATLGDELAAEFYALCAQHIFAESARLPATVETYLYYADEGDAEAIKQWVQRPFHFVPQIDVDFGGRMAHAFRTVFSHGAQKAVIVGTDVPDLSAAIIQEAFQALDWHQVVIGPDHDGGYYLLGLRQLQGQLFTGMAWGTDQVFEQTWQAIAELGLSAYLVPTLMDIDTETDLRLWVATVVPNVSHPLQDYLRRLGLDRIDRDVRLM